MSILNLYQLAFIATIVGTIVAANWARRHRGLAPVQGPAKPQIPQNLKALAKLTAPVAESVRERVKALDKLFDENIISVEEYVELRKRAVG